MRDRIPALALAALLTATAVPQAEAQEPETDSRPGVAVLKFDNGGSHGAGAEADDFAALEVGLQQMLLTELSQNTNLRIVERGRLRDLLAELELAEEGRTESMTAAEVGRLVGARYVVIGSFMDLYGQFRMDARVVDVETSEILRSQAVQNHREHIYDLLVDLAEDITAEIDLPPLPAAVREERKEREIPLEAITLYSRAQVFEDAGQKDRAIELYQRVRDQFPEMVQAREALEQLTSGA